MKKTDKNGQYFLEYGMIIIIVVAALIAMRVYLMRNIQEKYRQTADVFGEGEQFAKGITKVDNFDKPGVNLQASPSNKNLCSATFCTVDSMDKKINGYDVTKGDPPQKKHYMGLLERADLFKDTANQMRAQAAILDENVKYAGISQKSAQLKEQAAFFDNQAAELIQEANNVQIEINKLKTDQAECFSASKVGTYNCSD
jgi:hypothetical protein